MENLCLLIGNCGKDPEVHTFDSGTKVAKFSFATTKNYKDKSGEKVSDTSWHNIEIWGKLADIVEQYVKKGDKLYLKGEIRYRDYEDKDGNKKYITEINCFNMQMLGSKPSESGEVKPEINRGLPNDGDFPNPDDIPFP